MTTDRRIRPDIQGLRGVAVLAVIANHFTSSLVPNGYLGVDIFFVISGFVITGSLSRSPQDSFWPFLASFYERRVRRLMPALIACIALTALAGLPLIPPDSSYFVASWKTGFGALFGLSNLYLHRRASDYFGVSSQFNLFTQTWSLGVEEQFYFFFPSIVWLVRFGRRGGTAERRLLFVLGIGSAISLVLFVALDRVSPAASFFLIPSRFWELGTGALTFTLFRSMTQRSIFKRSATRTTALLALAAVLLVPGLPRVETTIFIAFLTVILLASEVDGSIASRVLESRPLVHVGLISYSLYLWHWSVLVISRWSVGVRLSTAPFQIALMFLLAHGSFFWIEQPLRRRAWLVSPTRSVFAGLFAAMLCAVALITLGTRLKTSLFLGDARKTMSHLSGTVSAGEGVSRSAAYSVAEHNVKGQLRNCNLTPHFLSGDAYQPKPSVDEAFIHHCVGGDKPKVVLVGDSFAEVIAPHVELAAQAVGRTFGLLIGYGCPYPLRPKNIGLSTKAECELDADFIQSEILRNLNRGDVLVLRLFFGKPEYLTFDSRALDESTAKVIGAYDVELETLNRRVNERGAHLLVIGANPILDNSPICQSPQWFNRPQQRDCGRLELTSSVLTRFALRQEEHLSQLLPSERAPGAAMISSTGFFCARNADFCPLVRNGDFLWSDDAHIKPSAIDLFYPEILAELTRMASAANGH